MCLTFDATARMLRPQHPCSQVEHSFLDSHRPSPCSAFSTARPCAPSDPLVLVLVELALLPVSPGARFLCLCYLRFLSVSNTY